MRESKSPKRFATGHSEPRQGVVSQPYNFYQSNFSEARTSVRSSLSQVIRPMTSRTRLLTRHISYPRSLERPRTHSGCHSRDTSRDGFDSWDTSSVGYQTRQAVLRSSFPVRGTALETIPGSRPDSLAFPLGLQELAPAHIRTHSGGKRFPSPTVSEAHIHPLFRSDSPTPPPTATVGTVVTAAPFGGQMLMPHSNLMLAQIRSGSFVSLPSPLVHSRSFDDGAILRSPTPPSREMTPPIPEYILSAGSRTSFISYGRRKASFRSFEDSQPG
ncbi:hypothetical protein L228DRAFT_267965 [Xylona heveae TC161]|uniref:Uncharacterized protein n=1 Tax=Xylona heveae (strain CBS 132557 / TC161) TaxID=1328760 RepID=A0A165GTC1_XYLHT|nr:hypothetical protein L228DRAFT_267965 [Xylona heveae TC161]KZF22572.1 hypothetical protein L228DRAFT_267965 [Xylona heveae TC161]